MKQTAHAKCLLPLLSFNGRGGSIGDPALRMSASSRRNEEHCFLLRPAPATSANLSLRHGVHSLQLFGRSSVKMAMLELRAVTDQHSGRRCAEWVALCHLAPAATSTTLFVDGSPLDPPITASCERNR